MADQLDPVTLDRLEEDLKYYRKHGESVSVSIRQRELAVLTATARQYEALATENARLKELIETQQALLVQHSQAVLMRTAREIE